MKMNNDEVKRASSNDEETPKMTRRAWLERAVKLSLGFPALVSFFSVLRYLEASVEEETREIYLCRLSDIPIGQSRLFRDLGGQEFIVTRDEKGIRAFSTRCTHLGCRVHWLEEKRQFFCPCHEGYFDEKGQVIAGPPPRPLDPIPVVEREGHLYMKSKGV